MQSCLQGGVCRYTSLGGAAWRPGPGSKAPQGEGRPRAPGAASLWSRRGTSPDQVPPLSLGLRLEERPLRRPTTPLSPGASSRPEASAPASRMEKGSPAFSAVGLSGARWRALRGSQDDVGVQRVTASPAQIGSHCASDQKRPVHAGPSDWTSRTGLRSMRSGPGCAVQDGPSSLVETHLQAPHQGLGGAAAASGSSLPAPAGSLHRRSQDRPGSSGLLPALHPRRRPLHTGDARPIADEPSPRVVTPPLRRARDPIRAPRIADRITRRLPLAEAGAPHSRVQLKRGHVRHTSILGGHWGSAWAAAGPRTRDPLRPPRTSSELRPPQTRDVLKPETSSELRPPRTFSDPKLPGPETFPDPNRLGHPSCSGPSMKGALHGLAGRRQPQRVR